MVAYRFFSLIWLFVFLIPSALVRADGNDFSIQYLEDHSQTLTLDQLPAPDDPRWTHSVIRELNLGFIANPVWVRIAPEPVSASSSQLLELANHRIDEVQLYVMQQTDGELQLEQTYVYRDTMSLAERPFKNTNLLVPLQREAGKNLVILARIANDYPMKLPFRIWDESDFKNSSKARSLFQGIYFGIVLIMAIYNLCIYMFVRDRSYGYYAAFILCLSSYVVVERGLAFEYLWPNHPDVDFQMTLISTALGCAVSIPFTIHFLSLNQNAPRILTFFRGLMWAWILVAAVAAVHPSVWLMYVMLLMLFPGGSSLFLVGIVMWRRGIPAAPYFTIAWAVLVAAATLYDAYLMGWLPVSIFTEYSLQAGNIIEVTLLSLGLAHRIKTLDDEKQKAHTVNLAKSEFLATMSHEIRTPMNGVLGMAELLRDTQLTIQQKHYLNTILSSGQSLLTVLNDILDYSKIEAGKLELEELLYSVRQLVDETTAIFAMRAKDQHLYYNVYIAPNVPQQLRGDPARVRQVLSNLISNAFKFTRQGSVIVRVTCHPQQEAILIEVQDSGIGIPQQKLAQIFERFTQADSSTNRQYGGTGLGLSISKRFIELMGGQIGVRSDQGQGSTFWFTLPCKQPVSTSAIPQVKPLSNNRIILATPDHLFAHYFSQYCSQWHLQPRTIATLQEAIALHTELQAGFVLIDQHCPDFNARAIMAAFDQQHSKQALQTILLMDTGAARNAFDGMQPPPWFEEFPLSISRLQSRLFETIGAVNTEPNDHGKQLLGMRVLVVDDNKVNAMVATGYLRKLGIEPWVVDSGKKAVELISSEKMSFDLVLMDCEMPEVDGFEATRQIRHQERLQHRPHQPICALSAHALDSYRQQCFAAGMNEFLTKPIVLEQLTATLLQFYRPVDLPN